MTLSFFLEGWRDWRRWTPGPVRERQCRRGNCEARGRGCRLLSSLQLQPTAHLPSAAVRFQFSDLTLCQTKHPPAARLQFAVHHGMAWLWILLFFTWVASLLVILFLPWGNSRVRFGSKQGDAEDKGTLRKEELYQACVILKVQLQRVKIIDHPDLQDGFESFDKSWNPVLVKDLIEEAVISWEIDTVITFDNYGISGHRNHQDVHTGLCMLMMSNLQRDIEAWELVSTNIARKYCGTVDVWWSIFESYLCQKEKICFLPNRSPRLSANAMAQHSSQWVWFRRLFVVFSRYTYMNTLRKIRL